MKFSYEELKYLIDIFDRQRIPLSNIEREKKKGSYPYYGASGIIDYIDEYIFDGEYVLVSEDGENLRSRKTPIIFKAKGKFWVNNHAHIIKGKENILLDDYLMYAFNNINISGYITGAAQPKLTQENLCKISIPIPENYDIQQKIAKILSNYDDLIENNNERIKILEEMAQKIYKEWFVEFKYPGHETATFKETELGKIVMPKKGKNITKATIKEGNIPVVAGGLEPAYYHNTSNTEAPVITVSASGANAGYVKLYYENIWASDCSYIDNKMTPYVYYFYSYLKYNQIDVTNLQKGAAQPHVYPQDLATLKITDINENVIKQFNLIVTPLFEEIRNINLKNKFLKQTKDMLLPRLMSGEIDIEELEIQ